MRFFIALIAPLFSAFLTVFAAMPAAADLSRFNGTFVGNAEITTENGEAEPRDLTTTIKADGDSFELIWTSVTYRGDGRTKSVTYDIEFVPSTRENIYQSAMKTNLFGKATPLDPLLGEPFVWARFEGDTFSVFSLFINETGDYDMQEFHRTLVPDGLDLFFRRVHNGVPVREINALLVRQD